MSERKEALEALLANIVAGEWPSSGDGDDMWLKFHDAFWPHDWYRYHSKGLDAYNGSLDAALALHDAVLPGWYWTRPDGPGMGTIRVVGPDNGDYYPSAVGGSALPARAWLIAIIIALIAATDTEVT